MTPPSEPSAGSTGAASTAASATATATEARPAQAGTAAAGRPARRAPAELPLSFATAELVEALVAERDEPAWLADDRRAALEAFGRLPVEMNQLYTTYVDLRGVDLYAARPYAGGAETFAAPAAIVDGVIPEGAAGIIELRGDSVARLALTAEASEAGVILETLGAAVARDAEGVQAAMLRGALPGDDRLAVLSRAAWSQGVHLAVPAGVRLEMPIIVRWLAGTPGRALLTRTLVRVGEDAELALVEEAIAAGPDIGCAAGEPVPHALFAATTEVELARNAQLRVAAIQDLPTGTAVFQQRVATLGAGAGLRWALAQLGSRLVRSRIDNRLVGDGSSVEQVEIIFGGLDQLFDLTAYTRHIGRDTTGNLLSKAVLNHGARAYLKGLITIEKSAHGTDSFLGEFGMLLDRKSRSVTIPSLEIDQPDCRRAAHSSSVGPIDPAQLFYLESRGITPDEARKFITLGFLEPVVARVPLEAERERLWALLEAKWDDRAGESAPAA